MKKFMLGMTLLAVFSVPAMAVNMTITVDQSNLSHAHRVIGEAINSKIVDDLVSMSSTKIFHGRTVYHFEIAIFSKRDVIKELCDFESKQLGLIKVTGREEAKEAINYRASKLYPKIEDELTLFPDIENVPNTSEVMATLVQISRIIHERKDQAKTTRNRIGRELDPVKFKFLRKLNLARALGSKKNNNKAVIEVVPVVDMNWLRKK